MRSQGNPPFSFRTYEAKKSLNWMSLLYAVIGTVCGWGATELVPYLEGQGQVWSGVGALLAVMIPVIMEWVKDNRGKEA